jgi:uncharacterized membrane protein YhdT
MECRAHFTLTTVLKAHFTITNIKMLLDLKRYYDRTCILNKIIFLLLVHMMKDSPLRIFYIEIDVQIRNKHQINKNLFLNM